MTRTADSHSGQPLIKAWSAVTAYGTGRQSFEQGVSTGEPARLAPVPEAWRTAEPQARFIADFDAAQALGRKGTRSLDRLTALALSAVSELLATDPVGACPPERTALVLGTNGSTESMMNQTRTALTSVKPFFIDAAKIPSSVLNCAASRCAIWYGLTGPNATLATGRVAALSALSYAGRLLRAGRADRVLCGAADEYSSARSWIDHAGAAGLDRPATPGEGAVMFSMQAPGAGPPQTRDERIGDRVTPVAEGRLLAVRQRVAREKVGADDIRACVGELLAAAGVDKDEVWAVAPSSAASAEQPVLGDMFGAQAVESIDIAALLGDTGAASGAVQLAAVLGRAAADPAASGRVAVITAVDPSGHVAAAAVRLERREVA